MSLMSDVIDSCAFDGGVANNTSVDLLSTELDIQLNVSEFRNESTTKSQIGTELDRSHGVSAIHADDQNSDDGGSDGSDADTELPVEVTSVQSTDPSTMTNATVTPDEQFVCPDDELIGKIVKQVEYYFSDENVVSDAYLLKHIKRNKQGYVSIKVISTFRKTKKLSKDPRVIAYALRNSDKLQVNDPGTKVRRINPLPAIPPPPALQEADPLLRTVVASNLPTENPTMESIVEQFSKCGKISQVRILRPGTAVPNDMKKHLEKHLEVGFTSSYALVEYEDVASATKACKNLTNTSDWRRGLRVVMLLPPAKKDTAKNNESKLAVDDRVQDSDGFESGETKKNKKKKKRNSRVMELAQGESPYSSSSSDVDRRKSPSRDSSRGSSKASSGYTAKSGESAAILIKNKMAGGSPKASPRGSPTTARRSGNLYGRSPLAHDSENEDWRARSSSFGTELGTSPSQSQSPWVQRRLKAQQESGTSPGGSPLLGRRAAEVIGVPPEAGDFHKKGEGDRVLRQPRGPDGTRGFKLGRSVTAAAPI